MKLRNFWLQKIREKTLLKLVEWAQKYNVRVESLSRTQITEAIKDMR